MPDLFVQRGDGLSRGPDVVNPLLTTVQACLARGRQELDEHSSGLQDVDQELLYQPNLRLGQIIGVTDSRTGGHWYGKIVGLSYEYTPTELLVTMNIKRPS